MKERREGDREREYKREIKKGGKMKLSLRLVKEVFF